MSDWMSYGKQVRIHSFRSLLCWCLLDLFAILLSAFLIYWNQNSDTATQFYSHVVSKIDKMIFSLWIWEHLLLSLYFTEDAILL